jgi:hypothetical protein
VADAGGGLTIDFYGEHRYLSPRDVLTFGRGGDLVLDAMNPYLLLVVGEFRFGDDGWIVRSAVGVTSRPTAPQVSVCCQASTSAHAAVAGSAPLVSPFSLIVMAGGHRYEITGVFESVVDLTRPLPALMLEPQSVSRPGRFERRGHRASSPGSAVTIPAATA